MNLAELSWDAAITAMQQIEITAYRKSGFERRWAIPQAPSSPTIISTPWVKAGDVTEPSFPRGNVRASLLRQTGRLPEMAMPSAKL